MLGAIAGDIIGSVYEANPIKTREFPLFSQHSRYTDDTVLTIAVADAILNNLDYAIALKRYGLKYPGAGYGGHFYHWIFSPESTPYNSWGNGAAMRVSPVGFAFDSLQEVLAAARQSAQPTHNHLEGIKGAQATATAIYLARSGANKDDIRSELSDRFKYNLDRNLDRIRPNYSFDVSCQGSVPESIIAFLESADFEGAIRNAISLGGDSDTMACIAGGIAQAFYGSVPAEIATTVRSRLPYELLETIDRFNQKYGL